ncbi:MAG: CAP domain-containing protein, partial [Planctomycetota bacterium]
MSERSPASTVAASSSASWFALDLGTRNYFAHVDLLGRDPSQRAINCGYVAGAGENIAAGTVMDTVAKAFEAWRGSPEHNLNMLDGDYKEIGIARAYVPGSSYNWYWVTDFGMVKD